MGSEKHLVNGEDASTNLLKTFRLQVVELLNPVLPRRVYLVQELQEVLTVM